MSSKLGAARLLLSALATLALCACGGGGGSGGGGGTGAVVLLDLTFPDPSGQSGGDPTRAPTNASLVQQVRLRFSGSVAPDEITSDGIQVRDAETQEAVPGTFGVDHEIVTFRPALPTRPIVDLGEQEWDTGGAGLAPNRLYDVTIPLQATASIPSLAGIASDLFARYDYEEQTRSGAVGRNFASGTRSGTLSVRFRTTHKESGFLTGYEPRVPNLTSVYPLDGASGLSPKLFTDPEGRFPPFESYRVVYDQPLDPALDNVSDATFRLVDRDASMHLGVFVTIVANEPDRCEIDVLPSGILPFGHDLELEVPRGVRQVSGGSTGRHGSEVISEFRIASAPQRRIVDRFVEDFHDQQRQETSAAELPAESVPADWDRRDSGRLQAAFGFSGGGELGPFVPLAPNDGTKTVFLDTNRQIFPLFDGSTPGAKSGTIVDGGVFNFTDIIIPASVIVRGVGRNPLVLTATGSVSIAGMIDVHGGNGSTDQSYDSAITPTPGGVGGPGAGRGGVGHPSVIDLNGDYNLDGKPDGYTFLNFLPPRHGEAGLGPVVKGSQLEFEHVGGGGGQSGIVTTRALNCNPGQNPDNDNGSRGSGGGGGTFLRAGDRGKDGQGDSTSSEKFDSQHVPIFETIPEGAPQGGAPGTPLFVDNDPGNDFIGQHGEISVYLGGQGGGGSGSRLDSYWCGTRYGGYPQTVADSKGGGGGGGGGAFVVRALGAIRFFASTGQIDASGGWGGTGEQIGCSNWGGGAGGGSGGLVVLESSTMVTLDDRDDDNNDSCSETSCDPGCDIDISVYGGEGGYVVKSTATTSGCATCNMARDKTSTGAGGRGGAGLVQLMVPPGLSPEIGPNVFIRPDAGVVKTPPSEITPVSIAQSTWIDVGQVIQRPGISPGWWFRGTDPASGLVITDADGNVPDPRTNSFRVDLMPVFDPVTGVVLKPGKADFVPGEATIRIEFQAGDAVEPGSKEVAGGSLTSWSPTIEVANGHQFLRYRVTFNIADATKDPSAELGPDSRLPSVRFLKLPFDF